ncbi:hypothetical protein BD410DRAFT_267435 [Rickenella mellea]|uniref:Uncharacterized protein n=1 Tax=Rickenella mellea TaxID=50990 RepID=A0A4Y7Q423_9AGAM|nr:hypothetical protein BD410DRAFT_267435 [Rickenella mellea]
MRSGKPYQRSGLRSVHQMRTSCEQSPPSGARENTRSIQCTAPTSHERAYDSCKLPFLAIMRLRCALCGAFCLMGLVSKYPQAAPLCPDAVVLGHTWSGAGRRALIHVPIGRPLCVPRHS